MKGILSKLLVVVNGSEGAIGAAKYALALSKSYGSEILVAYVVDTATIRQLALSRIFVPDESEEYERSLEDSGHRYLSYVNELALAQGLKVETRLLKGSIAGEVVRVADEEGSDCIIVGGWDRGSSFRDIILDAYQEVLRNAPCPVFVVKGKKAELAYKAL